MSGGAVLRGAVRFGAYPDCVRVRTSRYSVGMCQKRNALKKRIHFISFQLFFTKKFSHSRTVVVFFECVDEYECFNHSGIAHSVREKLEQYDQSKIESDYMGKYVELWAPIVSINEQIFYNRPIKYYVMRHWKGQTHVILDIYESLKKTPKFVGKNELFQWKVGKQNIEWPYQQSIFIFITLFQSCLEECFLFFL